MGTYKIAVTSSDGIQIDRSFRDASVFTIFEVRDDGSYQEKELRTWSLTQSENTGCETKDNSCNKQVRSCGYGTGCGGANSPKVELIADCRCLICTRIGFKIQKQLEKRAISSFDVECSISEALHKIIPYFERMDHHQPVIGIAHGKRTRGDNEEFV